MTKDEALAMDLALEALEVEQTAVTMFNLVPKPHITKAITAIKQARSAPVQEPVAFNAGVPPLYPEMKDGETISVEYTASPGERQSEDCLTAAQEDIQRLSALVRAQQITIDKLEQDRSAPVQEPVVHCEAGPEHCQQCHLEDRSLALAAAVRYVKNNTPKLVSDEICMALAFITAAQRPVTEPHKWVGLTDEDKLMCWARATHDADVEHKTEHQCLMDYGTEIEAKLKEKNA